LEPYRAFILASHGKPCYDNRRGKRNEEEAMANEISRTADAGELERCIDGCGQVLAATLILPVLVDGEEVVTCLYCHVEAKRIFM
jgi:hypothetical protein